MNDLRFQLNGSKLGKIAHFSTLPHKTCYQNCSYCYALKSVKMYPATKENYTNNTEALNNNAKLPVIPKSRKVVRMYVSGDFQSLHTIKEWIRLALQNKDIKFFGYTKQWKNESFIHYLNILRDLPNVVLRASVDNETGYNVPQGWSIAGIYRHGDDTLPHVKGNRYYLCKFSKNKIKCDKCKICFSTKLEKINVFFPSH